MGVLAVMRDLTDLALNSGGRRGEDEIDNEPMIELYENAEKARAAVAELIEATHGEYDADLAYQRAPTGKKRNDAWDALLAARQRRVAALERVTP